MAAPHSDQAVLTVDLGAIVANWRALGVQHGAPVAGVVKADAYGLGAAAVGRALGEAGCVHFFVAHLSEGLALRRAVGTGPMIAVLDGFLPGEDEGAALVPVLNSLGDVEAHATAARTAGRERPAILHIDTGMARLGLDAKDLAALAADHGRLTGIALRHVMTHLACADEPAHPMNEAQAARFAAACARLPKAPRSLANSSGLFLGPRFASELGRPGCALYGINPTPAAPNPMRQAVRLDVPVLQVRNIAAGESVGYGASWTAARPSRIATVALGYADGYLRSLSGRGYCAFGGTQLPLLGRVSMDLVTLDATDCPALRPGDRVTAIGGAGLTPDDLGARAGTIGYEILTGLGARYAREYIRG